MSMSRLLNSTALHSPPDVGGGGGGDAAAAAAAAAAGGGDKGGGDKGAGDKGTGDKGAGDKGAAKDPFYSSWGLDTESTSYLADSGVTDPAGVVKRLRDFDRIARDRNVIAKPDLKDTKRHADWEGHELLGWVKDPAKYTLKPPSDLPNGVTYSGELFDHMRKAMHEARVPLPAAQAAHDAVWKYMLDGVQALEAKGAKDTETLETELRSAWGGDYDRNSALAKRAMEAFKPNKDDATLVGRLMGEPALVRMFHAIGERIGEASLPAIGAGGGGYGALSKEQAGAQRRKLEGDKEWMAIFNNPRHALHNDYVAQRQRLINMEAGMAA